MLSESANWSESSGLDEVVPELLDRLPNIIFNTNQMSEVNSGYLHSRWRLLVFWNKSPSEKKQPYLLALAHLQLKKKNDMEI